MDCQKIHKRKIIQAICNELKYEYIEVLDPNDIQLRPIVASPRSETSHRSSLLDILLKTIPYKSGELFKR